MALGASRWRVVDGARESPLLAGSGLAIGCRRPGFAASWQAAPRCHTDDGWSIAATAAVLATSAILAGLLPANQASRIDPLRALRCD
jgi:hypothetical protein